MGYQLVQAIGSAIESKDISIMSQAGHMADTDGDNARWVNPWSVYGGYTLIDSGLPSWS
ncbi:hypothetical protein DACRYDRAFT_24870 [Dacryopinax primogenitus]|uniref:Uncharacterized protein n=1 Tax=Dacryopinax primogenitus (strain DJM 731) TaxID=1858805 RepID=M5FQU8_DACPD|nr:uncharacterized protein DACRYDRAFT_24870 [Dacryopinax primogenitus]EJT97958.1 hypothetical protein DACRYDRAFT_24870 [Dacryopinax primogenitus]